MSHADGPRTGRPPTYASHGMVSTPHVLASAAGLDALQRGGSAVDAGIAANAVLCVVYPHMCGLGGDGFWLIAGAGTAGVQALDASGPAGQGATREFYRERGYDSEIPARGALAALTVPGAVDGWREAHERFGRLKWAELFSAAIGYARALFRPISRARSRRSLPPAHVPFMRAVFPSASATASDPRDRRSRHRILPPTRRHGWNRLRRPIEVSRSSNCHRARRASRRCRS